jgi:hypothetical protein
MAKYKTFGRPEAVWNKLGGEDGVDAFLASKTKVVPVGGNVLVIDRSIAATYPEWKQELKFKQFENTGPTSVDLSTTIPYLHPKQKNGGHVGGTELCNFLESTGIIEHCLDLRFGEELVKQPHLFPTAWNGKYVFLWKSVVLNRDGGVFVPYVCEDGGREFVYWNWLGDGFCDFGPALLSAS